MHRIPKRYLLVPVIVLATALAFFAFACGDDGDDGPSAEEIQEVEEIITQLFSADGSQVEFVLDHATDNLVENVFFTTREDCQASPDDCIGEPSPPESITEIDISGDTASALVVAEFGTFTVGLVREDGVWKGDSLSAVSDEIPDDAAVVDLGLAEFTFNFDPEEIPADGNFAFAINNVGAQTHEVALAAIPADGSLMEAIETVEEPDAIKLYILPGQQVDMALDAPLQPGRYALVCFFPDTDDPEGTPHAFKGMLEEFTIE